MIHGEEDGDRAAIEARQTALEGDSLAGELIQTYPDAVVVLDESRQILLANAEALSLCRLSDIRQMLGLHPCEALSCVHSDGSRWDGRLHSTCNGCGLESAVAASRKQNRKVTSECSVASGGDSAAFHEIRVTASPAKLNGIPVSVVVMKDISGERQRRLLERLFFHDVLNTVSGLCGLAHALDGEQLDAEEETRYRGWLVELTTSLEEEIQHHRALLLAERDEYRGEISDVPVEPLFSELGALYSRHQSAAGRRIEIADAGALNIRTDAALLKRTLGNLLKNAIEATPPGETVRLSVTGQGDEVCFAVWNPGQIPEQIRPRLFHRFVTTKGAGRGLGTYSARVFGEKYLKGKLEFRSSATEGTTFTLRVPRSI